MAARTGSRIIHADDIKALIPEFDGGVGANAEHAESATLAGDLLDRSILCGDNLILPRVSGNEDDVRS